MNYRHKRYLFLSMSILVTILSNAMEEKPADTKNERYSACLKTCEFYVQASGMLYKNQVKMVCYTNCLENYVREMNHKVDREITHVNCSANSVAAMDREVKRAMRDELKK